VDRQTDILITVLGTPAGGKAITPVSALRQDLKCRARNGGIGQWREI